IRPSRLTVCRCCSGSTVDLSDEANVCHVAAHRWMKDEPPTVQTEKRNHYGCQFVAFVRLLASVRSLLREHDFHDTNDQC
ncbi:unnamed protein product, partial [Haemonchus placei]|uniref:Secreted protein n=1 Tax=Haemonchus placei TaxID=6290 RepID=A0A0N4WFF4_HAEPC